jgi:hypothetical protein
MENFAIKLVLVKTSKKSFTLIKYNGVSCIQIFYSFVLHPIACIIK